MKKFVIFIASMSLVLSPLVFAQKQTGGGGSRNSGGNATNVLFTPTQFRTNSIGQIQIKPAAAQTNGAFWSDSTTFALKAVGPVDGSQDAFRQFESTTDGTTGYKLYGNSSMKWALNSDGSGSGTGLLTVGSLATTGSTGTLLVSDSSVVVTNTSTGDNIVISTNGTITINGSSVSGSSLGYDIPILSTVGASGLFVGKNFLGYGAGSQIDNSLQWPVTVLKAGTITAFEASFQTSQLASSEAVTICVSNLTQHTSTALITMTFNTLRTNSFTNGQSCAVSYGDKILYLLNIPSFATNVTSFLGGGRVHVE